MLYLSNRKWQQQNLVVLQSMNSYLSPSRQLNHSVINMVEITQHQIEEFWRVGAVCIRRAFSQYWLDKVATAVTKVRENSRYELMNSTLCYHIFYRFNSQSTQYSCYPTMLPKAGRRKLAKLILWFEVSTTSKLWVWSSAYYQDQNKADINVALALLFNQILRELQNSALWDFYNVITSLEPSIQKF